MPRSPAEYLEELSAAIAEMTDEIPPADTPSHNMKGNYGNPHLVLLKTDTYFQISILVPHVEGAFVSWIDFDGTVYYPDDTYLTPTKWIDLNRVETNVVQELLVPEDWSEVLI